jgi:GTP cyclohydrolase I
MKTYKITWEEIYAKIETLKNNLVKKDKIYGIPRGGQIIAGLTGMAVDTPEEANIIVDDLYDSGTTYKKWYKKYPNKEYCFLYNKQYEHQNTWLEFPWENTGEKEVEENVVRLLEYFGEDTNREGLQDTPKRYIKFFKEFLNPPEWNCTTFESEGYDEMIVQTNIPFHSLCEHHIAPFFGTGHIAYIPNKRIVGLSKLARTLETFARRLQNQERITNQVAEFLEKELKPKGVAVVLTAKHMCMEMRGVKKHNTNTTTSKMIGVFKDDLNARNEFLNLIK